jgi:hypothetical protein
LGRGTSTHRSSSNCCCAAHLLLIGFDSVDPDHQHLPVPSFIILLEAAELIRQRRFRPSACCHVMGCSAIADCCQLFAPGLQVHPNSCCHDPSVNHHNHKCCYLVSHLLCMLGPGNQLPEGLSEQLFAGKAVGDRSLQRFGTLFLHLGKPLKREKRSARSQ